MERGEKMSRSNNNVFYFNDSSSSDHGVRLINVYIPSLPAARGKVETPPGRNGELWMAEGCYDTITIKLQCRANKSKHSEIGGWLTGRGKLRFSSAPGFEFIGRVSKQVDFKQLTADSDPLIEFTVTFALQPFRYVYPAPAAQEITTSGGTITNPGTVFSQPEIKLTGSGDITLVVNGYSVEARSLADGAVIDCELMETFNLAKTASLNSSFVMDEFPVLRPGTNIITWTGSVTKVEITPRWRYL